MTAELIVSRISDLVLRADPLRAWVRGTAVEAAVLPPGTLEAHRDVVRRMRALIDEGQRLLDTAPQGSDEDHLLDLEVLLAGLRRALPSDGPRAPGGAAETEAQVMAALLEMSIDAARGGERLAQVARAAPAFLAAAREGVMGCPVSSASVALAAAKRLPGLLDLAAAAARSARLPATLRETVEAGLGPLLEAAAEDAGWLVRVVVPAGGATSTWRDPDGELQRLAFGVSLAEVEAEAEAVLADRRADPPATGERPPAHRAERGLGAVEAAYLEAAAATESFCPAPAGMEVRVEECPAWLETLVAGPVAFAPSTVAGRPHRLLVGRGVPVDHEGLTTLLRRLHAGEILPAAWRAQGGRPARNLLPAPEFGAGWAALARAQAMEASAADRHAEAWSALLALAAGALVRGRIGTAAVAEMIQSETGLDSAAAGERADHVAAAPLAALAPLAGLIAMRRALGGGGAPTRAGLLQRGPLPGGLVQRAVMPTA